MISCDLNYLCWNITLYLMMSWHGNILHYGHLWGESMGYRGLIMQGFDIFLVVCLLNLFNTLRPRQNGLCFAEDVLISISLIKYVWIFIKISLFVVKGPINNNPSLVQVMVWCWLGDKPLSEPMMVRLPMHICITQPQWVKLPMIWDTMILI